MNGVHQKNPLQTSEVRYRRLFEAARDGILILEVPSGRITDANPFIAELLGYSREELLGKELFEIGLIQDRKAALAAFTQLQAEGYIRYEDLPLQTKFGTRHEVEFVSNVYDEAGAHVIQCNIRDITGRRKVDAAKAFLAALVESSEDSIISLDPAGVITTWNRTAERLYGYSAREAAGQLVTMLNRPADRASALASLRKVRQGEHVASYEETRLRKDGQEVDVSVQMSAIKDAHDTIIGISTISRDIGERKKVERELEESRRIVAEHAGELERAVCERTLDLHEKTRQMETFCYTVAHDLRAPLRAIGGYAAILREDYAAALGNQGNEYVDHIQKSAERLDELIQDLISYSRVSDVMLAIEPIDLATAVDAALKHLHACLATEHAQVAVERPLPLVRADLTSLEHVFLNLLSNALKFSRQGIPPKIRIYAEAKGDYVRVWVEDNGIGIPEQHREKVFGMFERLPEARGYPGTGIGLAIVSKSVQRLGGARGVEPAPGGGSRFWIELPSIPSAESPLI